MQEKYRHGPKLVVNDGVFNKPLTKVDVAETWGLKSVILDGYAP